MQSQKGNSPKSISSILYIAAGIGAGDGPLPRPNTAGRPQDVGLLGNYAPRCKSQITKHSEIHFHALLGDGAREVRLEWGRG